MENSDAYRVLVIKSENGLVEVNSIIETKNVDFFENIFPWKTNGQQQVQRNLRIKSSDPSESELRRGVTPFLLTAAGEGTPHRAETC